MYGAHHRVAPLRRGGAVTETSSVRVGLSCDTSGPTPMGTQADVSMQRGLHVRYSATPCSSSTGTYTLPVALQRSCLMAPSVSHPFRNSQQATTAPPTQTLAGDSAPLHAVLSQTVQHHKEVTTALLGAVETLRRRENHPATGCQDLPLLSVLVEGQKSQVSALQGLTAEVRAMVETIRDAVKVLRPNNPVDVESHCTGLVLGDDSPSMTSPPATNYNNNNNATGRRNEKASVGVTCTCRCPMMRYVSLGALEGVTSCAAKSQFVEDDVFSM